MSDQNEKPKLTFAFGSSSTSSATPSLFGTAATSSSAPFNSGLFSTTNSSKPSFLSPSNDPPASTSQSNSGTSTPQGQKPLFGLDAAAGQSTTPSVPPPEGGSLFGSGQQRASSGLTFGSAANNGSTGTTGGGLFGAKPGTPQGQSSIFSQQPKSSTSNIFGSTTGGSGLGSSSTPPSGTSAPSFFSNPSNPAQQTSGTSTPTGNLFGAVSNTPPIVSGPSSGTATPSIFANIGQKNTTTAPASNALFGSAPSTSSTSSIFHTNGTTTVPGASTLFGKTQSSAAPTSEGVFSNINSNTSTSSNPPASTSTSAPAPSLFRAQPSATTSSQAPTSSSATSSLFPSASSASQNQPKTTSGLSFAFPSSTSASQAQPSTTTATSSSQSGGLFGAQQSTTTSSQSQPAATLTTSSDLGGSLFGASTAGQSSITATTSAGGQPITANAGAASLSGVGGNTTAASTGATPSASSRLAQKSLDEILTMWSTSLTAHQKTFQTLAKRVSGWDRELVENSMKISTLYGRCFQAERDCSEVERQLSNVEHGQEEISSLLDKYEDAVDQMIGSMGVGEDGIGGVDAERERTYKTAETCSTRLSDLSHSLTDMVDEINTTSEKLASAQSTTGSDRSGSVSGTDPLSQIVRVLNGHLVQLQTIGVGAQTLQEQVAAAQRDARNLNSTGLNGNSTWVDDFGRSYLGRQ